MGLWYNTFRWQGAVGRDYDVERQKRLETVESIEEETNWVPPSPRFALESQALLQILARYLQVDTFIYL